MGISTPLVPLDAFVTNLQLRATMYPALIYFIKCMRIQIRKFFVLGTWNAGIKGNSDTCIF
jgi:hypothetical protein